MPHYKLLYFPLKGRAEAIRLMFAYAGVEFEDVRIAYQDWMAMKPKMPYQHLPVLEIDGKQYSQSSALIRYLAREFNLTGSSSLECLKADEFCEAMGDMMQKLPWGEFDDTKKKDLLKAAVNEAIPPHLTQLEANLAGDFCAGEKLTFGDIVFTKNADFLLHWRPDILDNTPKLKALYNRVISIPNIAKYLADRPDCFISYNEM